MFDWLGFKTGLPLWWSYRLNRGMKADVEEIFEGVALTRIDLLKSWVEEYWAYLERLHRQLTDGGWDAGESRQGMQKIEALLQSFLKRGADFSEIYMLDERLTVVCSTYPSHLGVGYAGNAALKGGLDEARSGRKCLFGPYADPLTLQIGPSTSSFHDDMTLLFVFPVMDKGVFKGALCGRVPNDVLGDLIQRESGHVYPDSGDNYIFMAKPGLNKHIAPGTALSRSRFEDLTFTHGDNLKDGVRTDYGIVQVREHTELELIFTDPATGQLHPGVASTIANGSNLFVEFPGYSDYRHIPVIGKGVTFQLPHCPDVWGMMCEGDLEEVYRIRSTEWKQAKRHLWFVMGFAVLNTALAVALREMPAAAGMGAAAAANLLYGGIGTSLLRKGGARQTAGHMRNLNRFIRINAEGEGDLTQRLDIRQFSNDEIGELAKWINNLIDSIEGIMLRVRQAAADVQESQHLLNQSTGSSAQSAGRVGQKINDMIKGFRDQLQDIDAAKEVSVQMSETLRELEHKASVQIGVAQDEVGRIGDTMEHIRLKVEQTNTTIQQFMETTVEIGQVLTVIEEISAQTNLLSLNASIEAARVGEHGKGFAVVAGEIRKLADLTKKSTEQISQTLAHIDSQAQEAFASMLEGTKVVQEGTRIVANASEILSAAGADESLKTRVVEEVVLLMEKIARVSMENRSISSEVESTVKELHQDTQRVRGTSGNMESITELLLQMVQQFQLTEGRLR